MTSHYPRNFRLRLTIPARAAIALFGDDPTTWSPSKYVRDLAETEKPPKVDELSLGMSR